MHWDAKRQTFVNQVSDHYGQQYFLPRGYIRLVVKPEGSGAAAETKKEEDKPADGGQEGPPKEPKKPAALKVMPGFADALAQTEGDDPADGGQGGGGDAENPDLISPVAYTITATRVLKGDQRIPPVTAKYNTNWFYSDKLTLAVDDDQLLSTVDADTSDRTGEVILNFVKTAGNLARAGARLGIGVPKLGALRSKPSATPPKATRRKRVLYRRLDIDVTFDPEDKTDVKRVERLFADDVNSDPEAIYISPFKFDLVSPQENRGALLPGTKEERAEIEKQMARYAEVSRVPKRAGLWFRELGVTQVVLTQNTHRYVDVVNAQLGDLRSTDEEAKLTVEAELLTARRAALSQGIARSTRLAVSLPQSHRTFAFNVPRSAFVQNRKLQLTIKQGLLTKVVMEKPSEAEGFSKIPLAISEEFLSVVKDLITVRTERVDQLKNLRAAEKENFTNQSALDTARATQADTRREAELEAEINRIDAQLRLLEKQRALETARKPQP